MRSGYSSRILEISKVPMPDPVPPPSEWVSWKPCFQNRKIFKNSVLIPNTPTRSCLPEGNRSFQLLCERHREQNPPTRLPRCSDPWPNCYRLHFGQKQSCQGGRAGQKDPNERNPWCQVPNPQEQPWAHICLRWPHCSTRWCAPAAAQTHRGRCH